MTKKTAADICAFLLVLLFTYSATVKLLDMPGFTVDMGRQPLPAWLRQLLVPLLPVTETAAALLLLFPRGKLPGFYVSAGIMAAFTAYVSLILLHYFKDIPCSCGGLIRYLSWRQHFIFNLLFLSAAVTGIILTKRTNAFIAINQVGSRTSC